MIPYSSLTPAQVKQVAYLFVDDVFGTDPHAYEYELKGADVIARSAIVKGGDAVHARKPRTVAVNIAVREVPESFVTVEMSRNAQITLREIARSVVERLQKQIQIQEA